VIVHLYYYSVRDSKCRISKNNFRRIFLILPTTGKLEADLIIASYRAASQHDGQHHCKVFGLFK